MILKLRYYPDPFLRLTAKEVDRVTDDVVDLVKNMQESLIAYKGLGLAATQVGSDLAVFIVKEPDKNEIIPVINPKIIKKEGKEKREEGCLSFPELYLDIERATRIRMVFVDIEGKEKELELEGILARAAQHEIDHLNGILIIDRISRTKRELIKGELERIAQRYGQKF